MYTIKTDDGKSKLVTSTDEMADVLYHIIFNPEPKENKPNFGELLARVVENSRKKGRETFIQLADTDERQND